MSEQNQVAIKTIEVKKIPIDSIQLSNLQARQLQVTKSLEIFAEQIRHVGLIQPVVVYKTGEKYELLVGQRRYYAHSKVLLWTEILAMIIEEPTSDMMKTTISWLENEARQSMSNKDMMRHVANMFSQKMNKDEIQKILGITRRQVNACIALPGVPDVVRLAVESGEISPDIACRATAAKRFEKYETSEDAGADVLDLCKKIQANKLSKKQQQNLEDYGDQNPGADNDTLLDDGIKNVTETIQVDLSSSDNKRLEKYAKNNPELKSKSEAAISLIIAGLDSSGD